MKKFNNYINSNVLFNVANLNSTSLGIKIIAGIFTSKAIAIFIGAEGLALIGNLSNFLKAVQSFSVLGFYKGIVKYIGEYKDDNERLSEILSTSFYVGFISTMLAAFLSYYNADFINNFLFSADYNYTNAIKILAIAMPFYGLNLFCFSIMNGFSKYRILLVISIIGQIASLLVTLLLIWQYKIEGAMIAIAITPALIFLITLVGILFRKNLISFVKITKVSSDILVKLSPYSIMAITSVVAVPIVLILIRNYIIGEIGLKEAGYWEAMNRISDYYLMFVNSLIALYLVPKLKTIDTKKAFRIEVVNFYKSLLPYFGGLLVLMYLLRRYVIQLIFTEEFLPAEDLFLWQLLGDFIRVLGMVIAYQFLAKKMFSHFIILEVFLFTTLYFSSIYLVDVFGLKGAVMGHFFTYLMYFGIVLLLFSSSLFGVISEDENL
ncbi:O-antigen translocase [Winogradskyella immobilis]|uniref:O-antigen translocase n=1 Tax=Winogradskyella immobilis TaxID=2816852 RepID=A0ABS8ELK4_9FLAO|nr:O-antigen translocase [Winogradskyella immobilis]MCC1484094.1 O-antigen translocase [Winogradskyella immobilis]MCG0016186.1 O-antigen translocase [Winogradskyella immobilis]